MSIVHYQAINTHGEIINGQWVGSQGDLQSFLKSQKITLVRTKSDKKKLFPKKVSSEVMSEFCFQLASLVKNGIHLTKSIQLITEQKMLKEIQNSLLRIQSYLDQGFSLTEAFRGVGEVFPQIFLQNLSMAERTGEVLPTLERLRSFFLWQHETVYKIKQAIKYPMLLACVLAGFLFVIFHVLLPNILNLIQDNTLNVGENIFLKSLLFISANEKTVLSILLTALSIPFLAILIARKMQASNSKILKILGMGQYFALYQTALLLRNLSMLLQVGIDLKQALGILIGDFPSNKLIKKMIHDVSEGCSFSQSLEKNKMLTSSSLGMIQVAEKSGTLPHVLETISEIYTNLFKQKLEKLISWTQPFLIVIMGSILIWIVLAVFLPLYESIAGIKF